MKLQFLVGLNRAQQAELTAAKAENDDLKQRVYMLETIAPTEQPWIERLSAAKAENERLRAALDKHGGPPARAMGNSEAESRDGDMAREAASMRCPFGRPHPPKQWDGPHSFMTAEGFIDYMEEQDRRASEEYWKRYNAFLEKYPTCWDRFLNWLGWK